MSRKDVSRREYLVGGPFAAFIVGAPIERVVSQSMLDEPAEPMELEIAASTADSSDNVLFVDQGETHVVDAGTTEQYDRADISGTLAVDGTLALGTDEGDDSSTSTVTAADTQVLKASAPETDTNVFVHEIRGIKAAPPGSG